jgi:hypothetical protein
MLGHGRPPEPVEWSCVGPCEREANRERVDHLCGLDELEVGRREYGSGLRILSALEGELDIVRGHRLAVVPAHIAAQVESHSFRFQRPALRQVRPWLEQLVVLNQRGEEHVVDHLVGVLVGVHQRVEPTHLGVEGDDRAVGDVRAGPVTAAGDRQRDQAPEYRASHA